MFGDHDETAQPEALSRASGLRSFIELHRKRGARDQGAALVEYALLLLLVFLAAILSIAIFGESLVALFDASANAFETAPNVKPEG